MSAALRAESTNPPTGLSVRVEVVCRETWHELEEVIESVLAIWGPVSK